jgi:hypothetical protein
MLSKQAIDIRLAIGRPIADISTWICRRGREDMYAEQHPQSLRPRHGRLRADGVMSEGQRSRGLRVQVPARLFGRRQDVPDGDGGRRYARRVLSFYLFEM